jgi:signal transduction histidine kinase
VIGIGGFTATMYADRLMPGVSTPDKCIFGFVRSIYVAFVVAHALFLLYMGSLVRRIKAKALWKGSLCYYLLDNAKKIGQKSYGLFRKVIDAMVNHKHFVIRTLGPYGVFLFVNMMLFVLFGEVGFFLMILLDAAVAGYLYYENKGREKIIEGITRICEGDIAYQIDSRCLFGENKVMADAVNRIGEAVNKAVQISMKDERLKADLITNVSHDIKTPLTSIINYVDLLKREDIRGEKAQEYIHILDEKSQRLKQLTLDLVEASKISSGNITLEMSDIDVKELLKQAVGEYEDKLEEKKLAK